MSEPRRSSRSHKASKVASYGEEVDAEHPPLRKRVKTTSSIRYNERKPHQVKVATPEQRAKALKLAENLKSSLDHPSFIRSMVKSHVYVCYWLSIPTLFCKDHLLPNDQKIILEDEKGEEHDAKFLAGRTGLSAGWRGFALKHKLHDGDAVIFELTKPARFKVHIIRAHDDLEEEKDVLVTEQNTEKEVDEKLLETELAVPIKEKAAPKPRADGSRKRNRRKLSKPVKSDDGVSGSKLVEEEVEEEEEEDDLIDDAILNGAAATNTQPKIKLFRRKNVPKTQLYSMRRTWAVEDDGM